MDIDYLKGAMRLLLVGSVCGSVLAGAERYVAIHVVTTTPVVTSEPPPLPIIKKKRVKKWKRALI